MKTFVKVIAYLLAIALLVGIIAVVYTYTNGFNEDFKTFYVEYEGNKILTEQATLDIERGKTHTFNVNYTFDRGKAEKKDYTVKIVPNISQDFEYSIYGEKYTFSKIKDITTGFKIEKRDDSFDLKIPQGAILQNALTAYHGGRYVTISQEAIDNNPNPFTLIVSSYNGAVTYTINLNIEAEEKAEELKIEIDGADVTNKYLHLYSTTYDIEVFARIGNKWVNVSSLADIQSDIGGDVIGCCLDISGMSISAYDYAALSVSYGGMRAAFRYCTVTEGETRWEEL